MFCRVPRLAGQRPLGYCTTLTTEPTLTRMWTLRLLVNAYFSACLHYKCSQNETTLTRARTRGDWPTLIFRTTLTRLGAAGVLYTLKSNTRQKMFRSTSRLGTSNLEVLGSIPDSRIFRLRFKVAVTTKSNPFP